MRRGVWSVLAASLLAGPGWAQSGDDGATRRVVIGANEYLVAGAAAIRDGRYDDGIRLTSLGLEYGALDAMERAAGLANVCAAHVAKGEPDQAIPFCTASLSINDHNWKAYSNRSQAYLEKGMYAEATLDNEAAAAISPNADHVVMIEEILNEQRLHPRITIREHP